MRGEVGGCGSPQLPHTIHSQSRRTEQALAQAVDFVSSTATAVASTAFPVRSQHAGGHLVSLSQQTIGQSSRVQHASSPEVNIAVAIDATANEIRTILFIVIDLEFTQIR